RCARRIMRDVSRDPRGLAGIVTCATLLAACGSGSTSSSPSRGTSSSSSSAEPQPGDPLVYTGVTSGTLVASSAPVGPTGCGLASPGAWNAAVFGTLHGETWVLLLHAENFDGPSTFALPDRYSDEGPVGAITGHWLGSRDKTAPGAYTLFRGSFTV